MNRISRLVLLLGGIGFSCGSLAGQEYEYYNDPKHVVNEKVLSNKYENWNSAGDRIKILDVNKDGFDDILLGPSSKGTWSLLENNQSGYTDRGVVLSGLYANWYSSGGSRIKALEFNGDGYPDVILGPSSSGHWYVLKNVQGRLVNQGVVLSGKYKHWYQAGDRIHVTDVNRDGLDDILLGPSTSGNWYLLENKGGGFIDRGAIIRGQFGSWASTGGKRVHLLDFTGDGYEDIVLGPESNGTWYGLVNNKNRSYQKRVLLTGAYKTWYQSADKIHAVDFDGDGLKDIVLGPKDNATRAGVWFGIRNTGTDLVNHGALVRGYQDWSLSGSKIKVADFNGDGVSDLILGPKKGDGSWYLMDIFNRPELKNTVETTYTSYYQGYASCTIRYKVGPNRYDHVVVEDYFSRSTKQSALLSAYVYEYQDYSGSLVWTHKTCIAAIPFLEKIGTNRILDLLTE